MKENHSENITSLGCNIKNNYIHPQTIEQTNNYNEMLELEIITKECTCVSRDAESGWLASNYRIRQYINSLDLYFILFDIICDQTH